MPKDVTAVLVGTGTLYLGPTGTAFPADPSAAVDPALEDVGYSEEGWTFIVEADFEDVEVAEEMDPILVLKTSQQVRMEGDLAQASLENIRLAIGGGTIAPGPPRVYTPPAAGQYETFAALFRANAPGGVLRDFQIPRVIAAGGIEMQHAKAPDKTTIGLVLRALKPAEGDTFQVVEGAAA